MGVYIKDMEMPENCALCPVWDAGNCLVAAEAIICEYNKRPPDCPLVPVPPHGDLIDAAEEMRLMQSCEYDTYDDYNRAFDMLDNAPTVIPAEE